MSKIFYKHHKQIDNTLHKAAFRGKVDKISSLLNHISPYKTTSEADTPLHLSLSKSHQNAANIFLNILEIDLTAVRQFLKQHQVNVGLDDQNFAFALGKQQIEMVKEKCGEIIVNPTDGGVPNFEKCSFILMKETVFSVPDMLVFRPKDQVQKFVFLSTVFYLLKENGVITANVQRSSDHSTVLHLAAARGLTTILMRLLDLGANPYLKDNVHQTAIGAAHSMGEFPTYVEMCRRLNLNMFATKDFVRLPVNNALWENVEFLIETLVALRLENYQESREKAIRTVLSMNELANTFLLSNVGEKCLEKYGQYLPEKKLAKIIMLLVNDSSANRSPAILQHILRDCTIVKEKTNRVIQYRTHNTVLHTLVRNGSSDIVRRIYQEFPRLKALLFEHKELGLSALIQCIQSTHVELSQFLIEEHEDEINRPEQWSKLLIAAAELPEQIDFMKLILEHRMTDPNLVLHGSQSIQTNALFVCISRADLEKVKVILESSKMTDLNIIQSNYETLLQSAICSMNPSTTAFGGFYDDRLRREFEAFKNLTSDLDTSEDEGETLDDHPTETNVGNVVKYATMNKIFDLLIEKGANFKHINSSYKTLLHHAVAKSNSYVVERLLHLGLDPIDPDRDGNLALHYVSNIEIFNILKNQTTFKEMVTVRNKLGAQSFHLCLRNSYVTVDLTSEFIDVGVDVNALDDAGNTPLHYLVTNPAISVCELLINRNANINLKNSNGYTAAHLAVYHENINVAALLFKQPRFDLFTLTNSGKSFLTQLTLIPDCNFDEIRIALDNRKEELDRLIELYCNEIDDNGFSNLFHSVNNKYLLELLIAQPQILVDVEVCKHNDLLLHKVGDNVEFARFLVDKGLDVNKIDAFHQTPLTQALTVNHGANIEVVRYLIEAGANVNYISWRGTTPLHVACIYFDLESIRILLEAGAGLNVKDVDGKIPFERLPIEYRSIITNIIVQ